MSRLSILNKELSDIEEKFFDINKKRNIILKKILEAKKQEKKNEDRLLRLQKARGSTGWDELTKMFDDILNEVQISGMMFVSDYILNVSELLIDEDVKTELMVVIGGTIIKEMYDSKTKARRGKVNASNRFYRRFGRADAREIIKKYIVGTQSKKEKRC